ncbi:MAG: leucine-rich repeat protein [Lachnospiraceae bacterium]|nr:leucine-rich repeat protein [Lachnospiraceae bacterium]
MSKKPIDKDKLIVRACYIGMATIAIMITGLFITYDTWSPKFREEWYGRPMDVTVTPTAAGVPEETAAPTLTEKPTELPAAPTEPAETAAPTEPVVTEAPAETVAPEVTEKPEVTVIPDGTENEEPVLTSVPTPSPMPTATSTPVPTTVPTPAVTGSNLIVSVQMGENVWYDYYEDGTMIVRGTGATWDLPYEAGAWVYANEYDIPKFYDANGFEMGIVYTVDNIVISEGITRVGDYAFACFGETKKIVIPDSLEEVGTYAFYRIGCAYYSKVSTVEWVNLHPERLKAEVNSFTGAKGLESMEGISAYMVTPTPTPTPLPTATPTPTPIPDPDNPRLLHTEPMGDDVVYEFWDNGYLYVKGTGKIKDNPEIYLWRNIPSDVRKQMKYYVVEEGITKLGSNCICSPIEEYWFPESLTSLETNLASLGCVDLCIGMGEVIHMYYEGKPVTVKRIGDRYVTINGHTSTRNTVSFMDVWETLSGEKTAEENGLEITWE